MSQKRCIIETKLPQDVNRKLLASYQIIALRWPWMRTSGPDFKVAVFFEIRCRKNGAKEKHSYCPRL